MADAAEKRNRKEKREQLAFVLHELTWREIRRKYASSHLGLLWAILSPFFHLLIMTLVFSGMFRRNIQNFTLYCLTGNVLWGLFRNITEQGLGSLVDNRYLLIRAKLPRQIFVWTRVMSAVITFLFTCAAFALIIIVQAMMGKIVLTWKLLLFPVDVLLLILFATGIAHGLSVLYVVFRDIRPMYSVFLTLLMYLCAIFYPVENLPAFVQTVIGYNPVYVSIFIARDLIQNGVISPWTVWLKMAGYAFVSFGLGLWVFSRYSEEVLEAL